MVYYPDDFKYTIKDIYTQSQSENKPMLSNYTGDFWLGYIANYGYFDRRFKKLYTSWYPFDQETKEGRQYVADEFRADVYAHLMANDKRYNELYRVNVIADNDAYSLTNNVDYTESYEEESHLDRTFNKGAQTDGDTGFKAYGQQVVDEDKSKTVGQQVVDEDKSKTVGQQVVDEDKSKTVGQQVNEEDISRTYGQHITTDVKSTSAYNDSTFTPVDQNERTDGTHTDTEDNSYTLGSHTDTEDNSITYGTHTDTEDNSITYGTHTDTEDNSITYGTHRDDTGNQHTEGAREDTTDDDGTKEYTLHKVGNMGVQTVDDMLEKHIGVWSMFDFYGFVFKEIARDLLRGV